MSDDRLDILLVGAPDTGATFRDAALNADAGDALTCVTPAEPLPFADTPDVVVLEASAFDAVGSAVRDWRTRPGLTPLVVVLVERREDADAEEARRSGADLVLPWPGEPGDCRDRLRLLLRLRRAENATRATGSRARVLERLIAARTEGFVVALEHLVEAARPGASARSAAAADLCLQLAQRFAVPERFAHDLGRAARLIELGHLAHGAHEPVAGAVLRAQTAENVLHRIEGLAPVATLLGSMAEHWDGTGGPRHLLSGQIPLRSRILALVAALLAHAGSTRASDLSAALEHLHPQSGTVYDPMVVTHLEALLQGGAAPRHGRTGPVLVPVPELREGMVLAEDLYTDSGFKLLPRGARLAPGSLEAIRRRHDVEPLHAAVVERTSL